LSIWKFSQFDLHLCWHCFKTSSTMIFMNGCAWAWACDNQSLWTNRIFNFIIFLEYFIHVDEIFLLYSLRHDKIFYFVNKYPTTMEEYSTMSYNKKIKAWMKFKEWMQVCEIINTFTIVITYKHYKKLRFIWLEN